MCYACMVQVWWYFTRLYGFCKYDDEYVWADIYIFFKYFANDVVWACCIVWIYIYSKFVNTFSVNFEFFHFKVCTWTFVWYLSEFAYQVKAYLNCLLKMYAFWEGSACKVSSLLSGTMQGFSLFWFSFNVRVNICRLFIESLLAWLLYFNVKNHIFYIFSVGISHFGL